MGCGTGLAKFILIFFNIIFWLSGAAILGVGIWLRVDKNILDILHIASLSTEGSSLDNLAYVLIGFGAFVFFVGFVGCCGAWHQNKILLGIYIFLLVVVMAGELAAGIGAAVERNKIEKNLKAAVKEEIGKDNYIEDAKAETLKYTTFGAAMNQIQWKFDCCGVEDYEDYSATDKWPMDIQGNSRDFPFSCCYVMDDVDDPRELSVDKVKNITACYEEDDKYFHGSGCYASILDEIKSHSTVLIGVGCGIAGLEVLVLICAVGLCCCIRKEDVV